VVLVLTEEQAGLVLLAIMVLQVSMVCQDQQDLLEFKVLAGPQVRLDQMVALVHQALRGRQVLRVHQVPQVHQDH